MKKIPLSCERNCKHSGKYSVIADDELFDVLNKYHLIFSADFNLYNFYQITADYFVHF